jgi:hypothetical protein
MEKAGSLAENAENSVTSAQDGHEGFPVFAERFVPRPG